MPEQDREFTLFFKTVMISCTVTALGLSFGGLIAPEFFMTYKDTIIPIILACSAVIFLGFFAIPLDLPFVVKDASRGKRCCRKH